jgi:ABC-type antimicrobial peptide transport system permease subunit
VLSHGIRERRHEFGVRVALGARRAHLTALVLREGALLVGTGAVIGCGLALAGTGLLRAMLFRVSPFDPADLRRRVGARRPRRRRRGRWPRRAGRRAPTRSRPCATPRPSVGACLPAPFARPSAVAAAEQLPR